MGKSIVLTIIALISTPGLLIISGLVGMTGFWIAIDNVVSGWMVVLIFAKHNWIYKHLCKHLERMVTPQCLSCYSCYCCEDYCCRCTHQLDDVIIPNRSKQNGIDFAE